MFKYKYSNVCGMYKIVGDKIFGQLFLPFVFTKKIRLKRLMKTDTCVNPRIYFWTANAKVTNKGKYFSTITTVQMRIIYIYQ